MYVIDGQKLFRANVSCYIIVMPSLNKISYLIDLGAKGPKSIRGHFGLRFSENLKFLNSCILHSNNKGNMS